MNKVSYALGIILADNLKQQGFTELNSKDFLQGFEALLNGDKLDMDIQSANDLVHEFMTRGVAEKNDKAGMAFLAENRNRPEVVDLPSGLQYEILVKGDGPKPKATDTVTTHYHGTLIDGTVFDSSVQRGQPASFPVNGVIQGWVEALQMMPVGSKWKLYVPSYMAYGERGAGQQIGPNTTLIFEVELISIG